MKRKSKILASLRHCIKKCGGKPRYLEIETLRDQLDIFLDIAGLKIVKDKILFTVGHHVQKIALDSLKGILWAS